MKHNKIIIFSLLFLTIIPFVTSLESLGIVRQNECINISQMCSTCSYVNISSIGTILNPNLAVNKEMSYFGNGEWRYEFCNTSEIGRYDVKGQGDINGVDSNFATYFEVTSSGKSLFDLNIEYTQGASIIAIGFIVALIIFLIYLRNRSEYYLPMISGIIFLTLGVFSFSVIGEVFNSTITGIISIILIGMGLFSLTEVIWRFLPNDE